MKLSEAIERFIELKIEGEPSFSEWRSIDSTERARQAYNKELAELREAIDAAQQKGGNNDD